MERKGNLSMISNISSIAKIHGHHTYAVAAIGCHIVKVIRKNTIQKLTQVYLPQTYLKSVVKLPNH